MPWQIAFPNQTLGGAVNHVVEHREIVVADRFTVEANPLIDPNQMRRSIETRPQSRSLQDGCQGSRRRTLAVGAGDQHSWEAIFRMLECCQKYSYVREIKLVRWRLRQLVAQRVHLRDCGFVVSHQPSALSRQVTSFNRRSGAIQNSVPKGAKY